MPGTAPIGVAYERGSQGVLISNAVAAVAQVGTAAPVGSAVFALPPSVSRGQLPFNVTVQVDFGGAPTGVSVKLLGSLDGVNFYPLGIAITAAGLQDITATVRFLAASIAATTFGTGISVSFSA